MNADLEHLVVLQAQDLELKRLREELADAPKRVAAALLAKTKAEATLAAAKAALAKEDTLRRGQQSDVGDRRNKIVRLRKNLDAATSTAQVTAFEHEIAFAEQQIVALEDEELLSMERTETHESEKTAAEAGVAQTAAALEAERVRAIDVTARNQESITGIEGERKALRAQIGEAHLANYDRVAKARGTGVSAAVDEKCSACQMKVRPQRWNDLTGKDFEDTIFTCESCGRALYYDPRRDAPVRWSAGDRLTAAAGGSKA